MARTTYSPQSPPKPVAAASPPPEPTPNGGHWTVSTRAVGEVLTSELRGNHLRILLFSIPSVDVAFEIQQRMEGLFADGDSASTGYGPRSIPNALRRAALTLLDLTAAIGRTTGAAAGAIAFYSTDRELGCVCVGGGDPDVWSCGAPFQAPWFTMRSAAATMADGSPARARAFSVFLATYADMRLHWPFMTDAVNPAGAVVEATWTPATGLKLTLRTTNEAGMSEVDLDAIDEALPAPTDMDPAGVAGAPPPTKVDVPIAPGPAEVNGSAPATPDEPSRFSGLIEELRDAAEATAHAATAPEVETLPAPAVEAPRVANVEAPRVAKVEAPRVAKVEAPRVAKVEAPSVTPPSIAPRDGKRNWFGRRSPKAPPVVTPAPDPRAVVTPIPTPTPVRTERRVAAATPPASQAVDTVATPAAAPFVERRRSTTDRRRSAPVPAPARVSPWIPASWVAGLLALFAAGWWIGAGSTKPHPPSQTPFASRLVRALGLAAPSYTVLVRSDPPGALITIDRASTKRRTPAEIEVTVGRHDLVLSMPDLGQWVTTVDGMKGERVAVAAPLTGSLQVLADAMSLIAVTVDGEPRGYAPIRLSGVAPGPHELEFTTPDQPAWVQFVRVPIGTDIVVNARPKELPATGVIEVRTVQAGDDGSHQVNGAAVFVDGVRRGSTPIELELPRGPHSVRTELAGQTSAVQVIDLPGGNERYATFTFGAGGEPARLVLESPHGSVARDGSTPVSALLVGVPPRLTREFWLHVCMPTGAWMRYPMATSEVGGVMTATVPFPPTALDDQGDARFYVSVLSQTGEEWFSEIHHARAQAGEARSSDPGVRRRPAGRPVNPHDDPAPPVNLPPDETMSVGERPGKEDPKPAPTPEDPAAREPNAP